MTVTEYPALEELAGWPYDEDDNPPQITEADIDVAAEIRDEDTEYEDRDNDDRRRENKWNPYSWG